MGSSNRFYAQFAVLAAALAMAGCTPSNSTNNTTAVTNVSPPTASASPAALSETDRPAKIKQMMAERGEQDSANPTLKVLSPRQGEVINGSTVPVRLDLAGELKGYRPGKDPNTGMGNHIHVILDNQPYEAYYDISQPFELRNVTRGQHTLRVFPSRPWHESYKDEGAFQMVTFEVNGGGDASKPTTTNNGQVVANNNAAQPANSNAAASGAKEGKDMTASSGGSVDIRKPLLTYSRPKGDYKGADADPIMIDFWLSGGKLQGDGGDYRVKYTIDGQPAKYIDKWAPVWLTGWPAGSHTIQLELVDKNGSVVDNGGYNSTNRTIRIEK
jgi:hypothetical protein